MYYTAGAGILPFSSIFFIFYFFFCFFFFFVLKCWGLLQRLFLYLGVFVSMVLQYFLEGSRWETSRMWRVSDDLVSLNPGSWFIQVSMILSPECTMCKILHWSCTMNFFTCTCCVMLVVKSVIHLQLASGTVSWAWPVKLWYYVVKRRLRKDH